MATKPTRSQDRGCDLLADALLAVAEAARLDGRDPIDAPRWAAIARAIASASTAFGLDEVVARALEARAKALGLRSGTAELLTLVEGPISPLECLRIDDDALRAEVARAEEELGDV
jgi:hypothetical protein